MKKIAGIIVFINLILFVCSSQIFALQDLSASSVAEARLLKTAGAELVDAPADYDALQTGDYLSIDRYTVPEKDLYYYDASSGHADDGFLHIAPTYISAGVPYTGNGRWEYFGRVPATYGDVGAAAASHTHTGVYTPYLTDPNANTLYGWDDTDNAYRQINIGTNLTYTHSTHTLSATGGSGSGDVIGPATNSANRIPAWNGTPNSKTLVDGYPVNTTVGNPGSDTSLVTEQAIRELFNASSYFDPANPGEIGGTTPAVGHFTDLYYNQFIPVKVSGVAGDVGMYEANSTDLDTAGERGPLSMTANTSYRGRYPNAAPTSSNMVLAWAYPSASGTGTPSDPYIYTRSFVDLDNYAPLASPVFTTMLTLPHAANPTVSAAGNITIDTSSGAGSMIRFYSDAEKAIPATLSIPFTIKGADASADYALWKVPYAITITAVHYHQVGGTNWVGQLQEGDSAGANGADTQAADSTVTADTDVTSFSNATLDAADYLMLKSTSVSGTNTYLTITVDYTVNPVN